MRTRLQRILGNRGFEDPRLDDWINDGLMDVTGAVEFQELECMTTSQTTPGEDSVALPNDLYAIKNIKIDGEGRILRVTTSEWFTHSHEDPDSEGVPEIWARDRNTLRLFPIPGDVYDLRLHYQREHSSLSVETERTEMGATWDRGVILAAAHHASMDLGEVARANDFLSRLSSYASSRISSREYETDSPTERGLNIARSKSDLRGLEM